MTFDSRRHEDTLTPFLTPLIRRHAKRSWWPGESAFEIAASAVLVQNTSWSNAEKAVESLRQRGALEATKILQLSSCELESLIRSSGTFRVKAKRLVELARWWAAHARTGLNDASTYAESLRQVSGIGPETADVIAVFVFREASFIADAYARRILTRAGFLNERISYQQAQSWIHERLSLTPDLAIDIHAALVEHAKVTCKKVPKCETCIVRRDCEHGRQRYRAGD